MRSATPTSPLFGAFTPHEETMAPLAVRSLSQKAHLKALCHAFVVMQSDDAGALRSFKEVRAAGVDNGREAVLVDCDDTSPEVLAQFGHVVMRRGCGDH